MASSLYIIYEESSVEIDTMVNKWTKQLTSHSSQLIHMRITGIIVHFLPVQLLQESFSTYCRVDYKLAVKGSVTVMFQWVQYDTHDLFFVQAACGLITWRHKRKWSTHVALLKNSSGSRDWRMNTQTYEKYMRSFVRFSRCFSRCLHTRPDR